jgi:hypothetical protein
LTGFIFVGISISLTELMESPHLILRTASSLALLLSVLVTSSLLLAPQHSIRTTAFAILGVGGVLWLATTLFGIRSVRSAPAAYKKNSTIAALMVQIASLPALVVGSVMLSGDSDGIYWLLSAFSFSFIVAVVDGWILLVEIHR